MALASRTVYFFALFLYSILSASARNDKSNSDSSSDRTLKRRLLLISFDGFRWDYLNGRIATPNFDTLKRKGVHARYGTKTEFVPNTLPMHFTLVTGLHTENHGFVDNFMYDPEMRAIFVPKFFDKNHKNHPDWHGFLGSPIWVLNQKQKPEGRSGVIMWVGGEATIQGIRPTKYIPLDLTADNYKKVDTIVEWFTDEQEPINLGLLYTYHPDPIGHKYGPDSDEVTRTIGELDHLVGYLLQKLRDANLMSSTDIIIASDHGFTSVSKDNLIHLDNIIDPTWYNQASQLPGPLVSIFPMDGKEDIVFELLEAESKRTGHFSVYQKRDIPERFHYKKHRRIGDIVAMAKIGYTFTRNDTVESFWLRGNHGYDNTHQAMNGLFVASGPSFKENYAVDQFHMVDIYPLMCHILNLKPAPHNGSLDIVGHLLKENPQGSEITIYLWPIVIVLAVLGFLLQKLRVQHQKKRKTT